MTKKRDFMTDIVFVILNYNLYDDVLACIDSLHKNLDTANVKMIVVDNASPNGVGKELLEYYQGSSDVEVILNSDNMGFARGNNVGIEKALGYSPKYIACINNDILLEQKNFFEILEKKYLETGAAIIGPESHKPNGKIQGFNTHLASIERYKSHYLNICDDKELTLFQFLKRKVTSLGVYKWLRNNTGETKKNNSGIQQSGKKQEAPKEELNVMLHGCFLIFTPAFFDAGLKGFNPKTFLYREEQLLFLSAMVKGVKTLYTPDLKVIHIGNVSTNNVNSNDDKKKAEFRRKHEADSLKILIEEMEAAGRYDLYGK